MGRVFFSSFYGLSTKRAGYENKEGKRRGSITCRTDRANEANKMFIIWLYWLFREKNEIIWRSDNWSRARGRYGYLWTWQWPITAREISQPYDIVHYEPDIRRVVRNMVFGAWVKVVFWSVIGRLDPLVLGSQLPPFSVVIRLCDLAFKHFPPPLVHQEAKRQEGNLSEGHLHHCVNISLWNSNYWGKF